MVNVDKWDKRFKKIDSIIITIRKSTWLAWISIFMIVFGIFASGGFLIIQLEHESDRTDCISDAMYTKVTEMEFKDCINNIDVKKYLLSWSMPLIFFLSASLVAIVRIN